MRTYLLLGITKEQQDDYSAALSYYKKGLKFYAQVKNQDSRTAYFLHNNAGYCLNILDKHSEAEKLCRKALEINPSLPNAYKNLGISLEEQKRYKEAAEAYIKGTKVFPWDNRSLLNLYKLLDSKPKIFEKEKLLMQEYNACVDLVSAQTEGG